MSKEKIKFYSLDRILSYKAQYNVIFGERSNGKTYASLKRMLKIYVENGKQGALIRRWEEDFKGKRGTQMFEALVNNGVVTELTNGEWTKVKYYSHAWYLSKFDEELNKDVMDEKPFCFGFSISQMEHDKSVSYPNVTTIVFDEFLTRGVYLPDEFVQFMNVVSTIVRHRKDVTIFMLGNTVNKSCPYFNEMGLTNIKNQEQGTIDLYSYGDSELRVAVEYCASISKEKESNHYFAFDNPKLNMITGGVWEMAMYPHSPAKYKPSDIIFTFFIEYEADLLQCECVNLDGNKFIFIHRKTTELKNSENDLIFSTDYKHLNNWSRRILRPKNKTEKIIMQFFKDEKVFYQDNEVGEIVRNYLQWCNSPTFV